MVALPSTSAPSRAPGQGQTYNAHPKQTAFHHYVRRYTDVLFSGGRGSGKTTAGAIQAILEAVQYQPGERGIVTAPTYPMLEDATMYEFFRWLPRGMIKDFNKQRRLLRLINGSEIAFRSCDNPDSLRGPNRAWGWMDEPRNLRTREAYDIISAQLRPRRKLWLTTTPSGIFHWIYDLFFTHPVPNSRMITVRTAENPYLPTSYEQVLRSQYTGAFAQQELDAAWVSFEGLIYDNFSLAENVSRAAAYSPDKGRVFWGMDDGYAEGEGAGTAGYHPRVVLLGQFTAIGGLDIFAEYYRTLVSAHKDTLGEVLAWPYPRPELVYADSSAAMMRGELSKAGLHNTGATHVVAEGIKNLRRLICDGQGMRLLRIHPDCVHLIREMQSYRYNPRSTAATAGEPLPLKIDDHGPDALRYLAWRLKAQG